MDEAATTLPAARELFEETGLDCPNLSLLPLPEGADPQQMARGEKLYAQQCAQCHGDNGEGAAGVYPRLAGNRAVTLETPHNTVQAILGGGFAPATAGHPRPYGMPPYRTLLSDDEVAAVASFVRQSWGNQAPAVSGLAVQRLR